jgi:hypothetical protein
MNVVDNSNEEWVNENYGMPSQYCSRWLEEIWVLIIDFLTVIIEYNQVKLEYL